MLDDIHGSEPDMYDEHLDYEYVDIDDDEHEQVYADVIDDEIIEYEYVIEKIVDDDEHMLDVEHHELLKYVIQVIEVIEYIALLDEQRLLKLYVEKLIAYILLPVMVHLLYHHKKVLKIYLKMIYILYRKIKLYQFVFLYKYIYCYIVYTQYIFF